ncbi:MAG: type II toxin-antitoxin system RelE/ParE family toxin [Candidatus Marinimicrobia bacterium]|jgi:mRNA interferase RelE/StbE|nr:type II toxin-antitoxin system RelE/ParE family toxin [Candidatus Neomarinimicrobiota bacterium]
MVSYKIKWDSRALKDLKKINPKKVKSILMKVGELAENPQLGKPLKGEFQNYRRLRVGQYRIVYSIIKKIITIQILRVGSRGSIYKNK